jgi:hypothetical protein
MLSLVGEGVHGGEVKEPSTVAQTLASTMAGRLHLSAREVYFCLSFQESERYGQIVSKIIKDEMGTV